MAKNYRYEKFVVDEPPEELYGWKYGVDNSKTQYDTHKGQRAAIFKSPVTYYLFALVAFMVFWFAFSFVHAVKTDGSIKVLLYFLPSFFALAVCTLIVFLTVFGVWGKFARWALKKNMVSRRGGARDRIEAETEAADANKGKEKALNIYEDYVEIINYGGRQVLRRSLLREVIITKYRERCSAEFVSLRGESVYALVDIPLPDIHKIKEIFGDICKVKNYVRHAKKKEKAPDFYRQREKIEFDGGKIGGLVMGFICVAAGGGVIAMHYCVSEKIPSFLGIFFIVGGLLAMLTVFDGVPVVKAFGIPFLFGVIFTGFPFIFIFSVSQSEGIKVVLPTFYEFLCSFSPPYCGMFLIAGMGILIIFIAFKELFKYIKYRK